MKEELKGPKVEDVFVAVVQDIGEEDVLVYNVYLINKRDDELEQVLITSKGYATPIKNEENIETTTLRKLMGTIQPQSGMQIEPIMEDVLALNNEYWVCFWIGNTMYDKKFVFLAETIKEESFVKIPVLNKKGILVG